MSKTSSPLDPRVLNSAKQAPVWSHAPGAVSSGATGRARSTPRRRGAAEDESEGEEERPVWPTASAAVRKIVLGQPPMGDAKGKLLALPVGEPLPDLAASFPNLTHLYLWQVAGLRELPPLPAGLVGLDVRGCPGLERVGNLPAGLETLVLEDCARLAAVPAVVGKWERLRELSVKGCGALAEAWVWAVVAAARALRFFDGSECGQLTVAPVWPPEVERIELNGCVNLARLADRWPRKLRRLGLRGCGAVKAVPDFPETMDYADLAGTASLLHLPARRGKLRTLFLRGLGVLVPPASEHGQDAQENVARRTAEYFADVELVGEGNVKRCKVLVLGNGGAGKTCLSLAVVPGQDPREAQRLGSTHGVQFWDWDVTTEVGDYQAPVHVHLWDFGGQEIYHNTHRLFMSVGAVFVVVWHPEQDGKPGPGVGAEGDYEDEWRPLRYWLDFIHHACPHQPRIAVVCSHQVAKTPELEARWRAAVGEKYAEKFACYFVDSWTRAGELGEFTDWLKREVGQVVATQGTAVPSYWELAQNLVSGWLPRRAAAGRGDGPGAGCGGGRGRAGETGGVGGGVHLVCVGSERGDSAGV